MTEKYLRMLNKLNKLNKYVIIDDCIKIASNYDGKVFGGYVRDVVVPKLLNPRCRCEFKDVDIWFKTDIDTNFFINDIKDIHNFQIIPEISIDNNNPHYQFNRTQYHLFVEDIVIWFDIVVSEYFPVDDFDVNFLVYSYKDNKELIECESKCFDKNKLITSINNKQMTILPNYTKRLISEFSTDVHASRINKRFLSRGWRIKYKNIYFPKPLTNLWLRKTFGYKLDGSNLVYIKNNDESDDCFVDFKQHSEIFDSKNNILDDDYQNKLQDNSNNCIIS